MMDIKYSLLVVLIVCGLLVMTKYYVGYQGKSLDSEAVLGLVHDLEAYNK